MIQIGTYDEFRDTIVAQSDDNDYDESGWVAIVKDGNAALARYSHCSCYGTWTAIGGDSYNESGGPPNWDWEGTVDQLVELAREKMDPNMPDRKADEKDYDYNHLIDVYEQILKWVSAR